MNNSDLKPLISAVILDLDGTLLDTEVGTEDILKDFLGRYGKVLDMEKEDKRLGATQKETAVAIVKDYDLPFSPTQLIEEIIPMYKERWQLAKPLPGANRLMMHLHKHQVPFSLASNALTKNIDTKISCQRGSFLHVSQIIGPSLKSSNVLFKICVVNTFLVWVFYFITVVFRVVYSTAGYLIYKLFGKGGDKL